MELFYTGAKKFLDEQKKAELSLGGFVSSTKVPNDFFGNLFGEVSAYTIDKNSRETIAIVLQNTTGADVIDVLLHFIFPVGTFVKVEVASVQLTQDTEGSFCMEKIENMRALPFVGTFFEANGIGNAVNLGNLADKAFLGLWLQRTLVPDIKKDNFECAALEANFSDGLKDEVGFVTVPLPQDETVELNLSWT